MPTPGMKIWKCMKIWNADTAFLLGGADIVSVHFGSISNKSKFHNMYHMLLSLFPPFDFDCSQNPAFATNDSYEELDYDLSFEEGRQRHHSGTIAEIVEHEKSPDKSEKLVESVEETEEVMTIKVSSGNVRTMC